MFDLGGLKPTAYNWLSIGISAITFILVMKYLVTKYDNPVTNIFKDAISSV